MALIHMRSMARVPIIIMGETGCGKTFLIEFYVKYVRRDQLLVFNIHAGITLKDIKEKIDIMEALAKDLDKEGKMLWIFFDEFNTTANVGLLTEIICKRKC